MRFLLRPATLFLLLTYLALSAVPFVPLLAGKPVAGAAQLLGIGAIAWLAAWAVLKRPAHFHWLLIPAFLALPIEVYLFTFYGQGISTHHLGILAETSPREAAEFLGDRVWLLLAVMAAVVAWWGITLRIARASTALDWTDGSRSLVIATLAGAAALGAYGWKYGVAGAAKAPVKASAKAAAKAKAPKQAEAAPPPLPAWARPPVELAALARSWPFGLLARGADFYTERKHLAALSERSSKFSFGARQRNPDLEPEIVVMVIGESSRFDRWSLNGYARQTNPLLARESNLLMLPDVVTAVSATRLSVPVIISRKPAMQSLKDGFAEKSFLSAYREAGFKTWWLSNQVSFGKFDTPVSVFAKEADVTAFLNLGGFGDNANYDQDLFAPLAGAIADAAPKKLIVLHTLGSHWNYSQRHPKQFDRFRPSLYGVDKPAYTDIRIKQQLNNSYDNTILYTDWFLANVIGQIKQTGQTGAMLYVADHGQTLYDNSCKLAFHGHNTKYEFHVPALLWYSDRYQERRPGKVVQLKRHHKARLSTENMFHTLLDLAEIGYPGERPEWSFMNERFTEHTRYVDSYGWANYDNATLRGDCREIIDKGTPLKRETKLL
ncbi:phosphoethanolamine transferase [Massilia glaciei]|uniref:DUF1705 domain-containing protein n=1 Tax=Massilia glaciei TaxID=1524097 RepID=A0A2U2I6N0_9BURK|nr:phosphoethanolamine transferase [Massilia glaciei]PWF55407.1 DUF1705 domain-containing protein [Massilia glaciei]